MITSIKKIDSNRISDERIKHMHGVAELMYVNYEAFDCSALSKEETYMLGLNHDIGYVDGAEEHEERGAYWFLGLSKYSKLFNFCIKYHGVTPENYMKSHGCSELFIPKELLLLWWADMMVESSGEHAGEVVGHEARLENIKNRFGSDSKQYNDSKKVIEWLANKVK